MRDRKRRISDSPPRMDSTKKPNLAPDEDEDWLESILAQIKAEEESEVYARWLQEKLNAPSPSAAPAASADSSSDASRRHAPDNVIEISDDEEPEDDEAVARRIAKQWEEEDRAPTGSSSSSSHHPASTKGKSRGMGKGKGRSFPHPNPLQSPAPLSVLRQYRELFAGEKSCSCGANVPSPRDQVMFSQQVPPPMLLRVLHAPCTSCNTNHCRGCMTAVSCSIACKGKTRNADCPVETCCAEVRAIALFEALGGFDKQYLGERATADERARKATAAARKTTARSVGPGGTGYGTDSRGGGMSAYGDYDIDDDLFSFRKRVRGRYRAGGNGRGPQTDSSSNHNFATLHFDEIIVRVLNTITSYLPSPYADGAQIYDMLPHPSIGSLLLLSQLPDLLGTLLRNDSVTDWTARIDVYYAMLALLRRLADCELTLEVLISTRWEGEGEIIWEKDSDSGGLVSAPPLYAHFKKLAKQCEAFLAGASKMLETATDGEEAETLLKATSLCGDFIAAKEDIERAMTIMGKDPSAINSHSHSLDTEASPDTTQGTSSGKDKGKGRDLAVDLERRYAQECERLAFQHGLEYAEYYYSKELTKTANATRNPRDRLHLVKELAVMATSLPPGVWVRVDEVRNDALKIMIAGPEGTPYAGGLFEFDCFIPLEYPHRPPLVHLRTTGRGSVRFNPNLYSDGKVCLSLLGTWPGRPEEQWSPKSTLLQVVVSIQSMILIDLPYFNEPGCGKADPKKQASVQYNKNIMMQMTRWAIVEWLKDEHREELWGVSISYIKKWYVLPYVISFEYCIWNRDHLVPSIEEWAVTEPLIRQYRPGLTPTPYMGPGLAAGFVPPGLVLDPMDIDYDIGDMYSMTAASGLPYNDALHALPRGRQRKPAAPAPKAVDLVAEYEEGIKKVRAWNLVEAV
ncbi:hypothetical protein BD413DRAFT_660998 [Trametes elegans]|nr:hypothetical protein BD413DRAFT_660998 [Trametes elegans]